MSSENHPNLMVLRQAYQEQRHVKIIMDYAASRKNNATEFPVDRAEKILSHQDESLSRNEIVAAFKTLANLGLGEFIVGRRGQPSRFRWRVPMIDAGCAARGATSNLPVLNSEEALVEEAAHPPVTTNSIRHSFNLRPNYTVILDLPHDFTERESARLAEFVKTLPFDAA